MDSYFVLDYDIINFDYFTLYRGDLMTFDWKDFHIKLDNAMAQMILDSDKLPSNTTLMEFAEYSNKKRKEQK